MRRESVRVLPSGSCLILLPYCTRNLRLFPLITPEWYMPSADVLLASSSIHVSCTDAMVDPGNKVQTGDGGS